ncbi:MAG: DegT/DnrJ/EryC1/StrS family aminotransferase, partial [Cyanobium sp.]
AESLGFHENSPGLDEGPDRVVRYTGTWGDLSTQSFYPPHHLTMGEGGAVNVVRDQKLKVIAESFRDWGRDCWCPSGIDNTCRLRPQVHLQPPGLQPQAPGSAGGDRSRAAAPPARVHRSPQAQLGNAAQRPGGP